MTEDQSNGPLLPRTVIVHNEAFWRHEGCLYSPYSWWRFADALARHAQSATLIPPLAEAPPPAEAKPVTPRHAEVTGRSFYNSSEEYYRHALTRRRRLTEDLGRAYSDADLVIVRAIDPVILQACQLAWRMGKPTVLLICGNASSGSQYVTEGGLKAALARAIVRRLRRLELRAARGSTLVAAWGEEIQKVFRAVNPSVALAAAPALSSAQIHRREDTSLHEPVRLLRVARLLRNKGLEYLIDAIAMLTDRGRQVHLDILGGWDDDEYRRALIRRVEQAGMENRISFHGQVDFGEELFDFYRNADIHVVSSLSEGLARVILEARAFGLPTIATRVGGIPGVVRDCEDGLLVAPSSAEQIADAIERLCRDDGLRRSIIEQGHRLAERETVEFQSRRLATLIHRALGGEPLGQAADDLHAL